MGDIMDNFLWMELKTGAYVLAIIGIIFFTFDIVLILGILLFYRNEEWSRKFRLFAFFTIVSSVLWIIVSILLIFAAVDDNRYLIIPWLLVVGLTIVINVLILCFSLFALDTIIRSLISILLLAFTIYSFLGMIAFFFYLKKAEMDAKA